VTLLTSSCGAEVVVDAPAVDRPYAGPLDLPITNPDNPDVLARSGSAGRALECAGGPGNGSAAGNGGPPGEVAADGEAALEEWLGTEAESYALPRHGFHQERADQARALYSFDVAGSTKVAIVASDSVTRDGDTGWAVEAWATCDPSELPAAVTDELGVEIWTDATGERVSTTRISSHDGAEHCDWQDLRFLTLNPQSTTLRVQFVRDTEGIFDTLPASYDGSAALPPDAVDLGFERAGQHLWVAADDSAAFLVSADSVERWPAAAEPILCR
jgi:hypothetical protein